MFSNDINDYTNLWENPSRYLLITVENTPYISLDEHREAGYVILKKHPLGYALVMVNSSLLNLVVEKMIAAKVEIRNQWIDTKKEKDLKHLWTDKVKEFALIPGAIFSYGIYHKEYGEYVLIENISKKDYEKLITKMIDAGVEIWDKLPEMDNSKESDE
jgi:hypothetical protein